MEMASAALLPSPVADDPNTRREEGMELFRASKGALRRIPSSMLTVFAERAEMGRNYGKIPAPPPIELVDYPDFFERAWGWDSLLPYDLITPLPLYKIYLRHYYIRNHQREANAAGVDDLSLNGDDHGNGLLAALADLCIEMERSFMCTWKHRVKAFTIDHDEMEVPLVSDEITKRAREMTQVPGSEFPAAAIALKCITKEAELMCQCIISGDSVVSFTVSNAIRQCALIFMTCRDYVPAAAAMMGIMKEAELAITLLKGDKMENNAMTSYTDSVRHHTMLMMLELCEECSAQPTVGDITGDLNTNESDNALADNGNHEEGGNVSENKELARNDMDGRNRTDENQNPNEKLGRNSLGMDEEKPDTKARTEKQVDPVGSSGEGYSSTSNKKLKDVLKEQSSPLYGKARGHKKWISGCFNLANRGGNANGKQANQ